MRPYQYRCRDNSLLTPTFKEWIVGPLLRFVPWGIPANIITIVSNAFVYVALVLALNPEWFGDLLTRLSVAVFLMLYLIGDHLDGMQAKRTGTGSALGEFCDHYLDAFNNGIIVFTMLSIFDVDNPWIVAICISTSYLAHTSVFYEQFKTGWLTFEKMGSLEGVLFASIIIGLSIFAPIREGLATIFFFDRTVFEWLMMLSALGAVITFFQTVMRTPDVRFGFWVFVFLLLAIAGLGATTLSILDLFLVLTLYASLYIGRVMQGHLVDGIERHTDFVSPVVMLFLAVSNFYRFNEVTPTILTVYILTLVIVLIVKVFSELKVYWVWVNARSTK
jgi:phosphatidylglycerophosphate synthase